MVLVFIILLFFSFPSITSSSLSLDAALIKNCHPLHQIQFTSEAHQNFSTHYIFLLNTNLDTDMQEQMLLIYRSITCMIQFSNISTDFHLITIGENNGLNIDFGSNPEKWINNFQNYSSSLKFGIQKAASKNQTVLNICEQLIQGVYQFVFNKDVENREILLHGLKNFVMFQMIDDNYRPEKCETTLNEFLKTYKLTNTIGISQNVLSVGATTHRNLPKSMRNETFAFNSVQKDPRFFTGALMNFENFHGLNNTHDTFLNTFFFVDEMIKISENFIKAYTKLDSNETMLRMVETLFDDFSSSSNITTTPSPISSPPIKTVTIFALICVLCLLAFVIIISSYDQSFCTDQNYIRERAWQFRRNRNNSETIGLVEVPFENISETIFGESPQIQAFSDSASSLSVEDAAILPSSRTEEDSVNIRSPNLYIQIENDNLAEIKLTE